MIPDIGFWEFIIILVVAILVVGPRDLPKVMHTIGKYVGKARRMAAEFQHNFEVMAEEAANETGVTELRREITAMESESRAALEETQSIDPAGLPGQPGDHRATEEDTGSDLPPQPENKPAGP